MREKGQQERFQKRQQRHARGRRLSDNFAVLKHYCASAAVLLLLLAAIGWIMLMSIGHVRAEPLPQPKVGQCPAGYRESGGPMNDRAPAAVPKFGGK